MFKSNALESKTNIPTDEEILESLVDDQLREQGFRWLVRKYQERLYWHVRRMVVEHEDANDVMQNTFIKVFRNIGSFKGQSKLYTWLYRIATNESLTHLKKNKRSFALSLDDEDSAVASQLEADVFFDGNEATKKLKTAIHGLPEKQQLVFNMRYYEEMSYQEISEVLGTSVGALKASYHHAAKKIEQFLKGD